MKTLFLLASMLASTATFAGVQHDQVKNFTLKNSHPDSVVIIDLDHLQQRMKDVSLLKPVFIIVEAVSNTTQKLHGKDLRIHL